VSNNAFTAFRQSCQDINRLVKLHTRVGGDAPGRRFGLEVLNKSAIVLITAIWEAYCEDLASEAVKHIVTHAKGAEALQQRSLLQRSPPQPFISLGTQFLNTVVRAGR